MNKLWIAACASAVALTAGALFAPSAPVAQAQINADGCTCSRPTALGTGADRLAVYHCVCPGIQCVVTATAATGAMPPNVAQHCK
ncbi:MAG TPA: hypothetical protein VNK91_03290 [Burkholderiaceae bacterium]|jgi:hypothetical protein|nr:hypothetical protein [Burkholderiaceae bacterium]